MGRNIMNVTQKIRLCLIIILTTTTTYRNLKSLTFNNATNKRITLTLDFTFQWLTQLIEPPSQVVLSSSYIISPQKVLEISRRREIPHITFTEPDLRTSGLIRTSEVALIQRVLVSSGRHMKSAALIYDANQQLASNAHFIITRDGDQLSLNLTEFR